MYIAKTVYENKIRKAVDFNFASQPRYILILFLLFERFPDFAHNRHAAASRFCLRLVYAELTFVCIVLVVNKRVVDADKAVFKINIAPAQPRYLANTQTCIKHCKKYRIPMLITRRAAEVIKKKFLFLCGKRLTFLYLLAVHMFQFSYRIVGGVRGDKPVLHGKFKHLMKHGIYVVDSRNF